VVLVPSHQPAAWRPTGGKKRLFFTVSTGHSGTMFLARAFKCGVNVTAEHEQKPSVVGFPSILRRGLKATYKARQAEKLAAFVEWVDKTGDQPYADISHMTVKSWADVALDWLLQDERYEVNFIVLRRWLPHVVRSFLLVDVWRPDTVLLYNGGEYTTHHRNFALLPPLEAYNHEDSVNLVLGYVVDMELQLARFKAQYPSIRFYETRSEDLFYRNGVRRFLRAVGLEGNERMLASIATARPVNQHVSWRAPEMLNITESVFLARASRFLAAYRAAGIPLPPMPALVNLKPCASLGITPAQAQQVNGFIETDAATESFKHRGEAANKGEAEVWGPLARTYYKWLGSDVLGTIGVSAAQAVANPDIPTGDEDIPILPAHLIGNEAGALGSALLVPGGDPDMMCGVPYRQWTPEEIAAATFNVTIPHNREPVSDAIWEENRVREEKILARKP
jgi:hypothetical protein